MFSVGRLRLTVLDDGTLRFPARAFFRNAPEPAWHERVDLDAAGEIPLGHDYGAGQTARELIVIDTGYGDDTHGGCTGHLLEELEQAGYRREEVTCVVNTHVHGDHIKGNTPMQDGESPAEAVATFRATPMHALAMPPYLARKRVEPGAVAS